ncbi:MAG: hypothetical protein SXG53_21910 [Pseudomonadota bacterium]|nr:hypothetical protein [Pseudomonadota bacterium]
MGLIAGLLYLTLPAAAAAAELSDAQIRQALIEMSISKTPGNCPCPYHRDSAGRQCGKRSAYSRPGGRSPLCYPADVTAEMVASFRSKQ